MEGRQERACEGNPEGLDAKPGEPPQKGAPPCGAVAAVPSVPQTRPNEEAERDDHVTARADEERLGLVRYALRVILAGRHDEGKVKALQVWQV